MFMQYRFTEYPSLIIISHLLTELHSVVPSSLPLEMPDQFVLAIKDQLFLVVFSPAPCKYLHSILIVSLA